MYVFFLFLQNFFIYFLIGRLWGVLILVVFNNILTNIMYSIVTFHFKQAYLVEQPVEPHSNFVSI